MKVGKVHEEKSMWSGFSQEKYSFKFYRMIGCFPISSNSSMRAFKFSFPSFFLGLMMWTVVSGSVIYLYLAPQESNSTIRSGKLLYFDLNLNINVIR